MLPKKKEAQGKMEEEDHKKKKVEEEAIEMEGGIDGGMLPNLNLNLN